MKYSLAAIVIAGFLLIASFSLVVLQPILSKDAFTHFSFKAPQTRNLLLLKVAESNILTINGNTYLKANITINNNFNLGNTLVPLTQEGFKEGLDIKNNLKENEAMLFYFQQPGKYPFWMHGMKFPIDIIWIDGSKRVIHIEHDLQPCITDLACASYSPDKDALYVLEVAAGFSQRHNVTIGTKVDFQLKVPIGPLDFFKS
jgi:uncharacterized membrane protein (UPF0127 family)